MGRKAIGVPVKRIVSVRVNDDEYNLLQELANSTGAIFSPCYDSV
jgi:hypothetical protein